MAISDIPEASPAGTRENEVSLVREGNQQSWEMVIFCFGSDLSTIVKAKLVERR